MHPLIILCLLGALIAALTFTVSPREWDMVTAAITSPLLWFLVLGIVLVGVSLRFFTRRRL